MIFKADLIDAINSLSHDLTNLSIRLSELEKEVREKKVEPVKHRGRPLGSTNKSKKTSLQSRGKDGKFAKKI